MADGTIALAVAVDQPRLLVVLCPERSGSTLLTLMLRSHSALLAPPELHAWFYTTLGEWLSNCPEARQSLADVQQTLGMSPSIAPGLKVADWYSQVLESLGDRRYLVDKTPRYARSNWVLQRLELRKPYYLWLVRHPAAVAHSRLAMADDMRRRRLQGFASRLRYLGYRIHRWWERGRELKTWMEDWQAVHERIAGHLAKVEPERKRRIHYDELVCQPGVELELLCGWLGIEFQQSMLLSRPASAPPITWGIGDPGALRWDRPRPERAHLWKQSTPRLDLPPAVARLYFSLKEPLS